MEHGSTERSISVLVSASHRITQLRGLIHHGPSGMVDSETGFPLAPARSRLPSPHARKRRPRARRTLLRAAAARRAGLVFGGAAAGEEQILRASRVARTHTGHRSALPDRRCTPCPHRRWRLGAGRPPSRSTTTPQILRHPAGRRHLRSSVQGTVRNRCMQPRHDRAADDARAPDCAAGLQCGLWSVSTELSCEMPVQQVRRRGATGHRRMPDKPLAARGVSSLSLSSARRGLRTAGRTRPASHWTRLTCLPLQSPPIVGPCPWPPPLHSSLAVRLTAKGKTIRA
jgi:hypothetical protein